MTDFLSREISINQLYVTLACLVCKVDKLKADEGSELVAMVELRAQNRCISSANRDGVCCVCLDPCCGTMLCCQLCLDLCHGVYTGGIFTKRTYVV